MKKSNILVINVTIKLGHNHILRGIFSLFMQKSNFLEFEISSWLVTRMNKVICVI